jgi:hypothetical protein
VRREILRSDRRLRVWPAVERLRGRRGPTSDGCDGCDGLRAQGEASFTKLRRRRSRRARLRGLALDLGRARTAGGGDFFFRFRAWGLGLRLRLRESRISIAEAKRKRGRRSATGDLCGSGLETLGPPLEPCLRGRSHGELARPTLEHLKGWTLADLKAAAAVTSLRGRSDDVTVVGFGLQGNGTGRGRLDQRRSPTGMRERERERERERRNRCRVWPAGKRYGQSSSSTSSSSTSSNNSSSSRARPLCLDFGVIGRECRLSDGGIPYNPSPYNKEANNRPTQSEQV